MRHRRVGADLTHRARHDIGNVVPLRSTDSGRLEPLDGALALDPYELKARPTFVTVPSMLPPNRRPRPRRAARHNRTRSRRMRRLAGGIVLGTAFFITLLLTAFGSGSAGPITSGPALASRLLPAGPPRPQVVATQGTLRLQLPISESRVTAIGYHASGGGALALDPFGRQANEGVFTRIAHKVFGGGGSGLPYYQLGGGEGPSTAALDVGALPGTDVYSPVDGTVVGLSPYILNGKQYGARVELQPAGELSVIVTLTHLQPDPALAVGSTVTASTSKVGTVLDFSRVERQSLARYTQDAGNHVTLQVFPAATLTLR